MNSIDYNYYSKSSNKKNVITNNNSKIINNSNDIHKTSESNLLNDLINFFNPFNDNNNLIEGFDTDCPSSLEDCDSLIQSLRSSGESLKKQNMYLDQITTNCSKNYDGVESLINININDKLKNEINRNNLLIQMEISFNTLDASLSQLIYYITNYMATGIHPLDKLNNQNGNYAKLYKNAYDSYDFIKMNYGHLYGETPTEFIYGVKTFLDIIKNIRSDGIIKDVLQYNPFLLLNMKYLNSLDINNISVYNSNNVLLDSDSSINISSFDEWNNNYKNKFIVKYKTFISSLNKVDSSGKIDIGGKNFTIYREFLLNTFEIDETKQNYFFSFPSGYNGINFIKDYHPDLTNSKGLLIYQLSWVHCNTVYVRQQIFINELLNYYSSILSYKKAIQNNKPPQVTKFIKQLLINIDASILNYCNNDYIKKTNNLSSENLKSNLSFRGLLEDSCYTTNYVECCYYLKTLNEATGKTYSECQGLDEINNLEDNKKYVNGVTEGLSQTSNNQILIYLKYINYYLCEMLRDSYCDSVLTADVMNAINSESTSTRDTIQNQSIFAASSSTNNSDLSTLSSNIFETFIGGKRNREGFEGNQKLIPGRIKFNDTVYNIIKNYTFDLDGGQKTLQEYTEDKLNESTCAPVNTPYFTASYKCGTISNSNPISNATKTDHVTFDCANPNNPSDDVYLCNRFYLILNDDGSFDVKRDGSNDSDSSDDVEYYSWSPGISDFDEQFILSGKMNDSPKGNILRSGETLRNGEFLCSENKTFNLINENGNIILKYKITPCLRDPNNSDMYGYLNNEDDTMKSIGMYFVDNTNIKHVGKSGYVNLNGELQLYNNPGYANSYVNVGNYTTSESENNTGKATNDEQILTRDGKSVIFRVTSTGDCEAKCNAFNNCGGFVYQNGICMLKNESMFPTGLRKADTNSEMYVRMKGVPNDKLNKSCYKLNESGNMTNKKYEEYSRSGNLNVEMRDINAPCDIVEATQLYKDEYVKSREILEKIKEDLNETLNNLTQEEKIILEKYNVNVKTMQNNIQEQEKIQKNTYKKIQNIDSLNVSNDDIHKSMDENLQYLMIYSVLTLGVLGFTFSVLKK